MTFAGSDEPGVCLATEVNRGMVNNTKCGTKTTTQRATIWQSLVTCAPCLAAIVVGRALVAAQNAVGTSQERSLGPSLACNRVQNG